MFAVVQTIMNLHEMTPGGGITVVTDLETRDDALILAEVVAWEHSERINVKYEPSGNMKYQTGFSFVTNNGTQVWYSVREI